MYVECMMYVCNFFSPLLYFLSHNANYAWFLYNTLYTCGTWTVAHTYAYIHTIVDVRVHDMVLVSEE